MRQYPQTYCRACNAEPGKPCVAVKGPRKGMPTDVHSVRPRPSFAYPSGPRPAGINNMPSDVSPQFVEDIARIVHTTEDTWEPRPHGGPSAFCGDNRDADLDDAHRYLRNLTFGITDDTLDPADIIRDLMGAIERIQHETDDKVAEAQREAEDEAQRELDEMAEERDAALKREAATEAQLDDVRGDLEQCEVDRDKARELAAYWEREAIAARNQRDELKLESHKAWLATQPQPAHIGAPSPTIASVREDLMRIGDGLAQIKADLARARDALRAGGAP